jgi:serine phosphatase RsbU (regulator of sigma subunit)
MASLPAPGGEHAAALVLAVGEEHGGEAAEIVGGLEGSRDAPPRDGRGEFGSLMIRGNRLGDLKESTYEAKTTQLEPGDTLIWYTDGIVECENGQGEEYGEKRFRASIRRAAHLASAELRDAIVNDSNVFFGETSRKDDITMVIGRIY